MNCDTVGLLLDDYADGTLAGVNREAVDDHLAACDDCRADADTMCGLLARVRSLPRSAQPARDLWPGIHAAALRGASGGAINGAMGSSARSQAGVAGRPLSEGEGSRVAHSHRRKAWYVPSSARRLAAAAALLVVVSSGATALVLRWRAPAPSGAAFVSAADALALARFHALESQYLTTARELSATLAAQRPDLAAETMITVEESVRIIDSAIRESRAALARDPRNQHLIGLLTGSYLQKIDLLRRSSELPARS